MNNAKSYMIAGGSNIQKADRELSDHEVYEAEIQAFKNAIDGMLAVVKKNSFEAGYEPSKARLFGTLMSKYFEWDGYDIAEAAAEALEDSNFHGWCKLLRDKLEED